MSYIGLFSSAVLFVNKRMYLQGGCEKGEGVEPKPLWTVLYLFIQLGFSTLSDSKQTRRTSRVEVTFLVDCGSRSDVATRQRLTC